MNCKLLMLTLCAASLLAGAETRTIRPAENGEGALGTPAYQWGEVNAATGRFDTIDGGLDIIGGLLSVNGETVTGGSPTSGVSIAQGDVVWSRVDGSNVGTNAPAFRAAIDAAAPADVAAATANSADWDRAAIQPQLTENTASLTNHFQTVVYSNGWNGTGWSGDETVYVHPDRRADYGPEYFSLADSLEYSDWTNTVFALTAALPAHNAGTTNAVWSDWSSNHNDAFQTGTGYHPTRVYTNGAWGLVFDGVDDRLLIPFSGAEAATAGTILADVYIETTNDFFPLYCGDAALGNDSYNNGDVADAGVYLYYSAPYGLYIASRMNNYSGKMDFSWNPPLPYVGKVSIAVTYIRLSDVSVEYRVGITGDSGSYSVTAIRTDPDGVNSARYFSPRLVGFMYINGNSSHYAKGIYHRLQYLPGTVYTEAELLELTK